MNNVAVSSESEDGLDPSALLKVTVERGLLLKVLGHLQSVVERRNTMAILANVMIEAKDGQLRLTATDMEISFSESIPADIQQYGALTVSAQLCFDVVRKLPQGAQLLLYGLNDKLYLQTEASKFSLPCLPVAQFPVMDSGDLDHRFCLSAAELLALVSKPRFAISQEETRYYLHGIYLHIIEDAETVLAAAATDGHKLAKVTVSAPPESKGIPGVILPRKTVVELKKILEDNDDNVQIALSGSKVCFSVGDALLLSKLIDASYPDYGQAIPKENDNHVEVELKSFVETIDRVSVVSSDKDHAIVLQLADNKLTLSARNEEYSDATESFAVSYNGAEFQATFNARYLLDMLANLEQDQVTLRFGDRKAPLLVQERASVEETYVVMPMNV